MSELLVELYGVTLGHLVGDARSFDFLATPEAIEEFGLDSPVLSLAVPLALIPLRSRRPRRQNFFAELLPEGPMATRLALQAGVAPRDVPAMLRAYGRDVAGALQVWDPTAPGEPTTPAVEALDEEGVADLLTHVAAVPLANRPLGGKTSLAGVQPKIVLARHEGGWARAINGYPSSHILKPASKDYPSLIYDEEYGARLARALGLTDRADCPTTSGDGAPRTPRPASLAALSAATEESAVSSTTWIETFAGVPALVIKRYDRVTPPAGDGAKAGLRRLHQEDFNQILGASGDQKYQKCGGLVSLARIARQLAAIDAGSLERLARPGVGCGGPPSPGGDAGSLERLARLTVLAVASGNLDLHAKNLSVLHYRDGTMTLAPAYDVAPQAHLPNDGELALAIDGVYRHAAVTRAHLENELTTWGLAAPDEIVDTTLANVLETVEREIPHPLAYANLRSDIARFTTNLIKGRPMGAERSHGPLGAPR